MRDFLRSLGFFLFISAVFFYKFFLTGLIPFPGDLLIGNSNPYNSYSFLGYAPGGFPHKAQNVDVLEQLYPWKHFSIEMLKKFEFPLWNPHNFSGTPHIASIQSGTFYPLNLIFFLLPFVLAWSIFIYIQPVLAGIFTFLFLRELKLSFNSSLLGGLAFSFSSFLVVWMQYGNIGHAIIWLPFLLWVSLKNLRSPTIIKSIIISLALAFSILAGHFQVSLYLFIFLFIFVIFNSLLSYRNKLLSRLGIFTAIYIVSILLSLVQILPSIELFLSSARSAYSSERILDFLIPQYHLITMLIPDFFGNPVTRNYWLSGTYIERVSFFGIVPLCFALYAVINKKSAYVWFFLLTMAAVFLLAFDSIITKFLYSIYVPPVLSSSIPTRMMFIFVFAGSVLAAFGYDKFEKNINIHNFFKTLSVIGGTLLLSWAFIFLAPSIFLNASWTNNLSISLRNLVLPSLIFIFFAAAACIYIFKEKSIFKKYSEHIKRYFFLVVLLITIFELFFNFVKFTPFSPKESVYPATSVFDFIRENQGIYRSWGYGSAKIASNTQTYEKLYSPDGYDPFHIKRYGELLSSTKDGKVLELVSRSNAELALGFGNEDLRENTYRQRIMDLTGVKYVFHKKNLDEEAFDQTFNDSIYKLVWYGNGWQVYENQDVFPRAFLMNDYVVIKNKEKIIEALYGEVDLLKTIILEEEPEQEVSGVSGNNKVNITHYGENKVVIDVESSENGFLFLSDAFFPGWKAFVNDAETKIYRSNYAFRSVFVPAGTNEVRFVYDPSPFKIGLWVSLATAGVSILYISFYILRRRKIV